MSLNAYPLVAAGPALVVYPIRLLGTGAADPTKEYGPGVSVTRTGAGLYRVTFKANPLSFVGGFGMFGHTTPAAGVGNLIYIDSDSYNATNFTLDFAVEDPGTEAAAPALVDLSSSMKAFLFLVFARTTATAV